LQKLIDRAFYFISGHGRGWAFSSRDLLEKFSRSQADNLLSELVKQGKIRRVGRGVYDYPKYSKLLKKSLSPDIDQVARAIASGLEADPKLPIKCKIMNTAFTKI